MSDLITFKPFVPRTTTIINPTELPHKPLKLDVPVTSNHQNRKRFISDWELRTWYEFKNAKSSFFVTLTYDDMHVPKMSDGRLAFSPDNVCRFFKRFRDYLTRKLDYPKSSFRYFLCSEYGKNTHRPHHHALFFFDEYVFPTIIETFVRKAWSYGFICCEVPDSNRVLTYVSKYVAKDMFSMDISQSKDDEEITEKKRIYDFPEHKYVDITVTRYNFHRQSMGYGAKLLDDITEEELNAGVKYVFMGGPIARPFAIPKYVSDKLLRYREWKVDRYGNKVSRTFDTDLGKRVHVERVKRRVDDIELECIKLRNQRYVYLDLFGIDIDPDIVSIEFAYSRNFHHSKESPKEDFFDYLLNKRYRAIDFRDNIPLEKKEKRQTPMWNAQYAGYEQLLIYLTDIEYILDCHSQRKDEINEFNNLIKKRRYGRSY